MISRRHRLCFILFLVATAHPSGVAQSSMPAPPRASDDTILKQAQSQRSLHHPDQAEATLQPLLTREPENVAALVLLAHIRIDQANGTEASQLLVRALAASPNSIDANNALGDLLLGGHHCPEAMDRFETVLKIAPRDPAARHGEFAAATELAVSAHNAGHPEVALQVLQHARAALPDDLKLLVDIGVEATDLHLLNDASDALNAARTLRPNDPDTLYALAQLEIEQQHMADAEADLRAYLAIKPDDASAHFGLGHIYAMQQRVDLARAEFNRSIALQPVQTECYYQLGQLELDAQHDAQAEPLFQKVLARNPGHGGALAGIGVIAFRAKDYAKAEEYLAKAVKAAPDYGPAHYYRGLALARMGRKDEADAELHLAAQLGQAAANPVHQEPAPENSPPH